mmetsp:Transcript_6158/g.8962  ORF Transcript_6158/g.8962 Transcript_6158/m.8962 type:complete len:199 (+) Transcript_6158:111-707(+)
MADTANDFILVVNGEIKEGYFPGGGKLAVNYEFIHGKQWIIKKVSGTGVNMELGSSQVAIRKAGYDPLYTWNFPLSCTFGASDSYGWPKIVFTVTSPKGKGRDQIKGYGWCHVPLFPGRHQVKVHMFKPRSTSIIQSILGYRQPPELITKMTIAQEEGRAVMRMQTCGTIQVQFDILIEGRHEYNAPVMMQKQYVQTN